METLGVIGEIADYDAAADQPNAASARGTWQPGRDRVLDALDQSSVVAEQDCGEVVRRDERRRRAPRGRSSPAHDRDGVDGRNGGLALLGRRKEVYVELGRAKSVPRAGDVEDADRCRALLNRNEPRVGQALFNATRLPRAF